MTEAKHSSAGRDAPEKAGSAAAPSPAAPASPSDESGGASVKTIKVQLFRSPWGRLKKHRACVAGLGLRRIGQTAEVEDTPSVRGMIARVSYMVRVIGE